MVSEQFCDLCREYSVPFRPVPLTLVLQGQQVGSYYFFLPGKYVALLDTERSEYEIDTDLETGQPMVDQLFPPTPVYKNLKIRSALGRDLQSVLVYRNRKTSVQRRLQGCRT